MRPESKILEAIGVVHSPFKEKFGLPRQASLIRSCSAEIELLKPFNTPEFVQGLQAFSDIWLIFGFHKHEENTFRPLVRPPRLGGNKKVGVFASRSPFRPNGLGLSHVKLLDILIEENKVKLKISCPDMIDGTPIYDIKPYIHYADANDQAVCGFAQEQPEDSLRVEFSEQALSDLTKLDTLTYPKLKQTIIEVLTQNPSPAYKNKTESKQYGMLLYDLNITWQQHNKQACVQSICGACP